MKRIFTIKIKTLEKKEIKLKNNNNNNKSKYNPIV